MDTPFQISGRYFWRNGRERPRVGLLFEGTTELDLVSDDEAATRLAHDMRAASDVADFVGVRPGPQVRDGAVSLAAAQLDLGVVYPVDVRTKANRRHQLAEYASAGVRGLIVYRCGSELHSPGDARAIESHWIDFAHDIDWPCAVLASGALARRGSVLRGLARASDACGVTLRRVDLEGPSRLADLSLVARLLSVRVEDEPAILDLDTVHGCARAAALSIACGYGLILAPAASADTLRPVVGALPDHLDAPTVEPVATFLSDCNEGDSIHEDPVQGSLVLLKEATGRDARFCFQDRPDLPKPTFLWVCAHGGLTPAAWTRLQAIVHSGCHAVLSCFEPNDSQRDKFAALETAPHAEIPVATSTFDRRRLGKGSLTLLGGAFEHEPRRPEHVDVVRSLARAAGLPCHESEIARGDRPVRSLHFSEGAIDATANSSLAWRAAD
ncbi:MAG: hypothetical protein H6832_10900 [Planctomycetes bacterium]|nr:hypothetical protein [Planctomycetota bacterium]MCB9891130.1 hypothetical protein [Planctomycetota bacterium]MCB9918897.1 hypothetical protein [Planctomycetota bacterium]